MEKEIRELVNIINNLSNETKSIPVIFNNKNLGFLCNNEKLFFSGLSNILYYEIFSFGKSYKNNDDNEHFKKRKVSILLALLGNLSIERFGSGVIIYDDMLIPSSYLKHFPFPKLNISGGGSFDLISGLVYKDAENE